MRNVAFAAIVMMVGSVSMYAAGSAEASPTPMSDVRATIVTARPASTPWAGTQEYDSTNISGKNAYASPSSIAVELYGGTLSRSFDLNVDTENGVTLTPGMSVNGASDDDPAYASLALNQEGCEHIAIHINDIAFSGTSVTRFDLVFRTNCTDLSNDYADIYGEVSAGEPQPSATVTTGVRDIAWPNTPVGSRASADIPVWIRNVGTSAQPVGPPLVGGSDASDFTVAADSCPAVLDPTQSCTVDMAFTPQAAGSRAASLSIEVGQTSVTTLLTGTAPVGQTFLRVSSQAGDWVGQGGSYRISDADSPMKIETAGGTGMFTAHIDNDANWVFRVVSNSGALTVGTHAVDNAGTASYDLYVSGFGRGCGSATGSIMISQIRYADGVPVTLDATFTQRCSDSPVAALTGEITYRAAPPPASPVTTKPAPSPITATKPRITRQPRNQTVRVGHSVYLHATATGKPAPAVSWQINRGHRWASIPHAARTSLHVRLTRHDAKYRYRARFTNSAGTTYTRAVRLIAPHRR